jgi:ribonuclease P protein component
MLPKKYRNIKREYFQSIYSKGKRIRGAFGSISFLVKRISGTVACVKFAVTPNKTFGDAVNRNLQKRRASNVLKAIVDCKDLEKLQEALYYKGKDSTLLIVYHMFREIQPSDFPKLKSEMERQINEVFTLATD